MNAAYKPTTIISSFIDLSSVPAVIAGILISGSVTVCYTLCAVAGTRDTVGVWFTVRTRVHRRVLISVLRANCWENVIIVPVKIPIRV